MENDGWWQLLETITRIKNTQELNKFFELFLTIEELETMRSRFLIIRALLEKRLTQREIAKKYRVSIAQITRGSNALKIIDPEFKKFLESQIKDK